MRAIYVFLFSVEKEGIILPGGDAPTRAAVEIPFVGQDEIEQSMGAIKLNLLRKKLEGVLPSGEE
jgi:hypothetical protein